MVRDRQKPLSYTLDRNCTAPVQVLWRQCSVVTVAEDRIWPLDLASRYPEMSGDLFSKAVMKEPQI